MFYECCNSVMICRKNANKYKSFYKCDCLIRYTVTMSTEMQVLVLYL